jgi:hypothetical protein
MTKITAGNGLPINKVNSTFCFYYVDRPTNTAGNDVLYTPVYIPVYHSCIPLMYTPLVYLVYTVYPLFMYVPL